MRTKAENAERMRTWYAENKERAKEISRTYRAKNANNPDYLRREAERMRAYRAKNAERLREYGRAYYAKNRERLVKYNCDLARKNRAHTTARARKSAQRRHLKKKYGLSLQQYEAMVQATKRCPICRHKFDKGKHRVHIDHCHSTGVIRGILCLKCNHAEGLLGSVENAERLYKYMLKNELFYQGKS